MPDQITRGGVIINPVTNRAEGSVADLAVLTALEGGATMADVVETTVEKYMSARKRRKVKPNPKHVRQAVYQALKTARDSGEFDVEARWALVPKSR